MTGYCGLFTDDAKEAVTRGDFVQIKSYLGRGLYFFLSDYDREGIYVSKVYSFAKSAVRLAERRIRPTEQIECVKAELEFDDANMIDLRDGTYKTAVMERVQRAQEELVKTGKQSRGFDDLWNHYLDWLKTNDGIEAVIDDSHINKYGLSVACVSSHKNIMRSSIKRIT
jgi:hypothetical protein